MHGTYCAEVRDLQDLQLPEKYNSQRNTTPRETRSSSDISGTTSNLLPMQIYTALLEMVVGCLITIFVSHTVPEEQDHSKIQAGKRMRLAVVDVGCYTIYSKTGTSYESTVSNEVLHLGYSCW